MPDKCHVLKILFEKYKKNQCDKQRKVTKCSLLKSDVMIFVLRELRITTLVRIQREKSWPLFGANEKPRLLAKRGFFATGANN